MGDAFRFFIYVFIIVMPVLFAVRVSRSPAFHEEE